MTVKRIIIAIIIITSVVLGCIDVVYCKINHSGKKHYIAHAGGMIEGHRYTNSKEAVLHAIECGIKYIELDLELTSDSFLVAAHDWEHFAKIAGKDIHESVLSLKEFENSKILGRFTPLTYKDINQIFENNLSLYFVTDKISDAALLEKFFPNIKGRMFVECFSKKDYNECKRRGFYMPMLSSGPRCVETGRIDCYTLNINEYINEVSAISKILNPARIAVFDPSTVMTRAMADSIFHDNSRICFVYIDEVSE